MLNMFFFSLWVIGSYRLYIMLTKSAVFLIDKILYFTKSSSYHSVIKQLIFILRQAQKMLDTYLGLSVEADKVSQGKLQLESWGNGECMWFEDKLNGKDDSVIKHKK